MKIETICKVGKAFSAKREKAGEDEGGEIVVAHLKISEIVIDRTQLDFLLRQPVGWCTRSLFDDSGMPWLRAGLDLLSAKWTARGALSGPNGRPRLNLKEAKFSGASVLLIALGGELSGELTWTAAGDEVEDVAAMLGAMVTCSLALDDGGQSDWVDDQRHDATTVSITRGRATRGLAAMLKEDGATGEIITPAGERIPIGDPGVTSDEFFAVKA